MGKKSIFVVLTVLVTLMAGCGRNEETPAAAAPEPPAAPSVEPARLSAGTINLGKNIDADKRVTATTETFARDDTMYVTVDTTGTGTATLRAKWTYRKDGQTTIVKEDTQTISTTGSATSEFHISKPDGWPTGDYQVDISLNDSPAGTKKFVVK